MAYKEGVNSDFFCPFTSTACNAGCSVNGLWLSKSIPLTNPCIQLCRDANKRSNMDFHHSSLKLTRSHLDQGRSRASPLTTDAK